MTRRLLAAGLACAALMAILPGPVSAQCAMCRQALASPEGRQLAAAFRSGIALLLVAPFSVFGAIAALAIRSQRRRRDDARPPAK